MSGSARGLARPAAAAIAILALLPGRATRSAAGIDIAVAARSIRPGELVVLTLTPNADASGVVVRAFEKTMPAYQPGPRVWEAFVGIDLDRKPGRYVIAVEARAGGAITRAEKTLVVEPRTFPTRKLRVDPEFVNPPASTLARIQNEAAFIREASSHREPMRLWSAPFVPPVPDPANSRFGTRSIFNGEPRRPHAGADFPSAAGTPVHAPNAGRVVAARELFFTGNTVMIDHGLGVVSLLAHLSAMEVREGELVSAGQAVGRVGATGRVTGPHLHWGLTVVGERVDPLSVLALVGTEAK